MPCKDGLPTDYELIDRVNNLTQLLCEACHHLDNASLIDNVSGQLMTWWLAHEKYDRKRRKEEIELKEQESLRRSALDKLTAEELKALGLDKNV